MYLWGKRGTRKEWPGKHVCMAYGFQQQAFTMCIEAYEALTNLQTMDDKKREKKQGRKYGSLGLCRLKEAKSRQSRFVQNQA